MSPVLSTSTLQPIDVLTTVQINSTVKLTQLDERVIRSILQTYRSELPVAFAVGDQSDRQCTTVTS